MIAVLADAERGAQDHEAEADGDESQQGEYVEQRVGEPGRENEAFERNLVLIAQKWEVLDIVLYFFFWSNCRIIRLFK